MKRVPAEEFARHAADYLEGSELVVVERDGEVIGRYVPSSNGHATNGVHSEAVDGDRHRKRVEAAAAFEQLQETLQGIYKRTGMTEDELVDLLDPSKPFPYDLDPEP